MPVDHFARFKERFKNQTDLELVSSFNSQVGNPDSGCAKMDFLVALREEFEAREIDLFAVRHDHSVSHSNRIYLYVLNGRKFVHTI